LHGKGEEGRGGEREEKREIIWNGRNKAIENS